MIADIEAAKVTKSELELKVYNLLREQQHALADPYMSQIPPGLELPAGKGAAVMAMARSGPIDTAQAFLNSMNYLHSTLSDSLTEQLAGPMGEFAASLRRIAREEEAAAEGSAANLPAAAASPEEVAEARAEGAEARAGDAAMPQAQLAGRRPASEAEESAAKRRNEANEEASAGGQASLG